MINVCLLSNMILWLDNNVVATAQGNKNQNYENKIATWDKLKKHMRTTFLFYNYILKMYQGFLIYMKVLNPLLTTVWSSTC